MNGKAEEVGPQKDKNMRCNLLALVAEWAAQTPEKYNEECQAQLVTMLWR